MQPSDEDAELAGAGVARIEQVDLLDQARVEALVGGLADEPRWDAPVSNAGISVPGPLEPRESHGRIVFLPATLRARLVARLAKAR